MKRVSKSNGLGVVVGGAMSGVKSVERAFAVLQCLVSGPAGVSEIADQADLPRSTVSRLLLTLERMGAVEQSEPGGPYGIGDLLAELAAARSAAPTLAGVGRPHLVRLVDAVGEAAGISILDEAGMVMYLDHVDADTAVQIGDLTSEKLPPHCIASGLVLLAGAQSTVRNAAFSRPLEAFTDKTMTDPGALARRLEEVSERGIAWTVGEAVDDVTSIAAPIFDRDDKVVGSIYIHGPTYRFPGPRRPDELEALVTAASARIARSLRQVAPVV